MFRRALASVAIVTLAVFVATYIGWDYVRGASILLHAAGVQGWGARLADIPSGNFTEEERSIPSRHGPLRARIYRPDGKTDRTIVLVPGVHADGIEEPRLVGFARDVARTGFAVVTPE